MVELINSQLNETRSVGRISKYNYKFIYRNTTEDSGENYRWGI